ncbi:hypothetical protein VOLCADRAFT_109152 [Volvox carteri f. nagariensis]|uniref:Uncharacterized protein n=1 Tax=Volvox carteri f. nagariensis TaxID=3068 RepID=D8TZX5_VOLCA|nr:uncharacterized protein VOLCADRAFT_109152 [Volvox carteri f. nagariensis]EFJ47004.1 hypothetical protein VOLCADRAFT_109152 [Volvox carteri f. nagariensis]|eukprot:XP_002951899.1 hypothetical protein VOLCADRAFT_109152 [Volvox carteri f. nagariensis]
MAEPGLDTLRLEDSDDDFKYEEVDVMSDGEDDASEDLDAALRKLQAFTAKDTATPRARPQEVQPGQVVKKPEVIDDFLRNFFIKMGLSRTCECFEAEWYELKATGRLDTATTVPDVYLRNAELEDEVASLRRELAEAKSIAARASATWDTFRKERDFHRMHHKRVAQEKNKLLTDLRRLKEHYAKYEPTILELKKKYEVLMKEKMMACLERDKLVTKVEALEAANANASAVAAIMGERSVGGASSTSATRTTAAAAANGGGAEGAGGGGGAAAAATGRSGGTASAGPRSGWASLNAPPRRNPYLDLEFPAAPVKMLSLNRTFKGHLLSVANLALHPTKPILVTASDDKTWKMWHMPGGDLIMCGEGHKDWVAGVDFHPAGVCLASGSGDSTVKIWDFEKQRCTTTFTDHKQVRLWDLPASKCRMALRGHVDSVNEVAWLPFTSSLATASSDKTVSIWDARAGLCTQTYYGHQNSCNAITFNVLGTTLASTDADGVVKLWDTRMTAEIRTINTGKHPANKAAFDRSGHILAVACDDGKIRAYSTSDGVLQAELTGHEDAVQAVIFDPAGQYLMSCGSDNTFRVWS